MPVLASTSSPRIRWMSQPVMGGLLRCSDCMILLGAALLTHPALWSPAEPFWASFYWPELFLTFIALLLAMLMFGAMGLYTAKAQTDPSPQGVLWALLMVAVPVGGVGYLLAQDQPVPPTWLPVWLSVAAAGLIVSRSVTAHILRTWSAAGRLTKNVIIVGDPTLTDGLAERFAAAGDPASNFLGVFHEGGMDTQASGSYAVLGSGADIARFAQTTPIDEVIVALPWHSQDRLMTWMGWLRNLPADVLLCPPVNSPATPKCAVEILAGMPLLKVAERPLAGWGVFIKGIEDRVLASTILALASPLMLVIALLIRLDSPGPALFRQKRHGFNNREINVLKFRTMRADTDDAGHTVKQATRDDPRVTRVGRWLRRSSLDELPQLLNVLKGEMSMVGPRPHAVTHNEQYARVINTYLARHRVKPGITGWAQVNGYRGETDTLEKMEMRVQYDLFYIDNWSLLLDLLILLRTVQVVFFSRNAY